MKNLVLIALLLSGLSLIQSCSKEEGPVGPQGPTGLTGATGAAGQNGISGAIAYEFTNKVLPFNVNLPVTFASIDSSIVLVYYKDAGANYTWYQAPGLGRAGEYQTRYFIDGTSVLGLYMSLYNPDGSTYTGNAITFSKVKLVLVPHAMFGKKENVDYSDYKATMKYYGLAE